MTSKSFSELSVQEFHLRLAKAVKDDAQNLYKQKSEIIKVENLIEHSPLQFLRGRPEIVIYSKLINNKNSQNLELAWTFEMTGEKGDIQANPIFFDGKILKIPPPNLDVLEKSRKKYFKKMGGLGAKPWQARKVLKEVNASF